MQVATAPGTDYAYIGLNLRDPILSHLEVRKAIGYAIDRDAIVKYLRRGFATTAVGIVPPMSWAFERNVFDFTHDPAEAARLLDAAGYPDPDGAGPLPRFRLSLKTSTSEVYRLQAAAIQHDLARVGIAVEIRSSEFQTLSADVLRGNFQLLHAAVGRRHRPRHAAARVSLAAACRPPASTACHYRNPDVDRLIDEAAAAADEAQRRRFYTRGAAAHRGGRAVHQPLVQDERRHLSAGHPRRHAVADRRFHVPEGRVSRSAGGTPRRPHLKLTSWLTGCASSSLSCAGADACRPAGVLAARSSREPLRSPLPLPDDLHAALQHLLPPGGGSARAPAGAHRRGGGGDSVGRELGRAGRPRPRHPRRSDRPLERLGDAGAVQPDRDHCRRAARRQRDREHRRLAAPGVLARVHAHRAPRTRLAGGLAACGACSAGPRCSIPTCSCRSGRSRASRRTTRAR